MNPLDNSQALQAIQIRQERKERVVFTNGCFDILHVGHVRYLRQARALGDLLVVGLNSDDSVRRIKGEARPILPLEERRELLLAFEMVDFVCAFDEDTPLELIKQVKPNILVKGGDWPVDKIVGADFVKSLGGETVSLPYVEGRSTSNLLELIQKKLSGSDHA